ncbi:MAG TPA: enolase C-terminal domain-like protein [Geminicoccus sp.]|uniref:enolase C-terminal domain-like protein n=1 Tax=Geminicoccus sp. TaxID=2024832 RepID=UPI002E3541A7|nr:enolase C-terminal domain-like protein [Geminicoccus sp.]HEX2528679.1 enolase C-terminal domain-like protein [Geminicoccus sp.]
MPTIKEIEFQTFTFPVEDLSIDHSMNAVYTLGGRIQRTGYSVRITDSEGCVGEWVNVNHDATLYAQAQALAKMLIGRDADSREQMYDDWKRVQRKTWGLGYADLDIALWDMAGKRYGVPVSRLLGGFRDRLPTYASTFHGDRNGGLSSKEAFADYAEYCYELGFRAFKVHGWTDADRREEAANVLHVASKVGDRMDLMLDPACELKTFGDALYVGRACDEAKFFWYEDPYRDGGYSRHAHKKLRQMLKTPILMGEHVRGLEAKADMIAAEATDYVRVNPTLDMGITGAMKMVHLAEAFGLDAEMHGAGPSQRHCMAAMRNTNYYELALCAPKIGNPKPPIYTCGYSDDPESVGRDGCFPVPTGAGLGVSYDWAFIKRNCQARLLVN